METEMQSTDTEVLRLELMIVNDLMAVAMDLHSRIEPKLDTRDEHTQLGSLMMLLRDRAGQLHERAALVPRGAPGDAFDRPFRDG
jgi:hypothetical protein